MNNFIFIDGIAFWIVFIFLILWFLAFIYIGNGYINSQREIDLKDKQLKKLRREYNRLIGEYHKATFKVPEVEKGSKNGTEKQNTEAR